MYRLLRSCAAATALVAAGYLGLAQARTPVTRISFAHTESTTQQGGAGQQITFIGTNPPGRALLRVQISQFTHYQTGDQTTNTVAECDISHWHQNSTRTQYAFSGTGSLVTSVVRQQKVVKKSSRSGRPCTLVLNKLSHAWQVTSVIAGLQIVTTLKPNEIIFS